MLQLMEAYETWISFRSMKHHADEVTIYMKTNIYSNYFKKIIQTTSTDAESSLSTAMSIGREA